MNQHILDVHLFSCKVTHWMAKSIAWKAKDQSSSNENIPKITILKEGTKGWTIVLSVVLYPKIWPMDNPLKDMAQLAA